MFSCIFKKLIQRQVFITSYGRLCKGNNNGFVKYLLRKSQSKHTCIELMLLKIRSYKTSLKYLSWLGSFSIDEIPKQSLKIGEKRAYFFTMVRLCLTVTNQTRTWKTTVKILISQDMSSFDVCTAWFAGNYWIWYTFYQTNAILWIGFTCSSGRVAPFCGDFWAGRSNVE